MNPLGGNISSLKHLEHHEEIITDGWRITPEIGTELFFDGMECYTYSTIPVYK